MNDVIRFLIVMTTFLATIMLTSKNAYAQLTITEIVDDAGLFKSLDNMVYFIITVGGFWIIGMLVWGGMTLASSGGNPQKRTEGIIKLSLVIVGAYVIYKSHDIAGWAVALGSAV